MFLCLFFYQPLSFLFPHFLKSKNWRKAVHKILLLLVYYLTQMSQIQFIWSWLSRGKIPSSFRNTMFRSSLKTRNAISSLNGISPHSRFTSGFFLFFSFEDSLETGMYWWKLRWLKPWANINGLLCYMIIMWVFVWVNKLNEWQ